MSLVETIQNIIMAVKSGVTLMVKANKSYYRFVDDKN